MQATYTWRMRPWIKYSLIRLSIFAVVLAALLVLQVNVFVASVAAAVAGLVISYIFFRRVRDQVAAEFAARNEKPEPIKNVDTDAEDEALDRLD
jgi:ABC-type bacteriocin/lantibiotic exporter with double-glycine peptidase domain